MPEIKQPTTKQEFLAMVRNFFNDETIHSVDKKEVWDILSALRGPDEGVKDRELLKSATTFLVRSAVLGEKEASKWSWPAVKDDTEALRDIRVRAQRMHFLSHAIEAFSALDLMWSGVNTKK